jgi:hypothetical protein
MPVLSKPRLIMIFPHGLAKNREAMPEFKSQHESPNVEQPAPVNPAHWID